MRNLIAAAEVNAAGALVGSLLGIRAAPVKIGSTYTFSLEPRFDNLDVMIHSTVTGALAGYSSPGPVNANDSDFVVSTFDAAEAPADRGFHVLIFAKSPLYEGDGGRGRLHSSVQVDMEPAPGTYFGRILRVVGISAANVGAIFDIIPSEPIDPLDSAVVVSPIAAAAPMSFFSIVSQTDSLLRVASFDEGGQPANRAFNVDIWRKGIGGG